MKIIDIHTHAQDILFLPGDATHVRPGPGFLIPLTGRNGFKWYGPREGTLDTLLHHIFRRRLAKETLARNAMATVDGLKEAMREFDIARSVILPVEPYGTTVELLSLIKDQNSLVPFASVDPHDPGRIDKLTRYMKAGCRGLKLHPIIQKFEPTCRECFEILEEYSQYELPVIFHCGRHSYYLRPTGAEENADPRNYVKLFSAFPGMRFILAHSGMFQCLTTIDIAERFENVYLETSFQPTDILHRAIKKVGADRVVYGSDWPFGGPSFMVPIVLELTDGNPDLRERLLWKNAERLIGEA